MTQASPSRETSEPSPLKAPAGKSPRTRLIVLGSGGGPSIHNNPTRLGPANVLVVDGEPYLIDAGEGAPRQYLMAGLDLPAVNHVFVTHHHFDHNSELGNFLAYAWYAGRREPVDVWGPPPLEDVIENFHRMHALEFRLREEATGRDPFAGVLRPHEIPLEGDILRVGVEIMQNDRVRVSAYRVIHGNVPSIAFRFKTPDCDIVFSADRGGQDDLASFAAGAEILVHEVIHFPAMERIVKKRNVPSIVLEHLRHNHSSPEEVGRTATAAGVKKVVLNHILPDAVLSDEEWIELVGKHYAGEVLIASDMLEII